MRHSRLLHRVLRNGRVAASAAVWAVGTDPAATATASATASTDSPRTHEPRTEPRARPRVTRLPLRPASRGVGCGAAPPLGTSLARACVRACLPRGGLHRASREKGQKAQKGLAELSRSGEGIGGGRRAGGRGQHNEASERARGREGERATDGHEAHPHAIASARGRVIMVGRSGHHGWEVGKSGHGSWIMVGIGQARRGGACNTPCDRAARPKRERERAMERRRELRRLFGFGLGARGHRGCRCRRLRPCRWNRRTVSCSLPPRCSCDNVKGCRR